MPDMHHRAGGWLAVAAMAAALAASAYAQDRPRPGGAESKHAPAVAPKGSGPPPKSQGEPEEKPGAYREREEARRERREAAEREERYRQCMAAACAGRVTNPMGGLTSSPPGGAPALCISQDLGRSERCARETGHDPSGGTGSE